MPIRFHRTLRIAPGVKLNVSKSGLSTTVGPKGMHITFGKHGIRRSVGIPGTGISEVDYIKKNETEAEKERSEGRREKSVDDRREEGERRRSESSARARQVHPTEEARTSGSTGLRNAFVLLGIAVFFFAGAFVLGLIPAHFLSNTLQYLAHAAQSTGH